MTCQSAGTAQPRGRPGKRQITVNGRTMLLVEAAEVFKIPYQRLFGRLNMGWPPERAVSEPRSRRGRRAKVVGPAPASPVDMPAGPAATLDGAVGEVVGG